MPKIKLKTKDELVYLILALPSLVGLLIFFVIPFSYSLYLSMIDNPVSYNFVWLQNFTATLNNNAFRLAINNTLVFMALCVPVNMALPLIVAILLKKNKHRKLFGLFFLLPLVVPSGSMVFFWQSLFGINGVINGVFFASSPINWLNSDYALIIILFIFMWKNAGFNIVLFQSGLNLIPKDYYECAAIEGAGRFRQFFSITLIYLSPTIIMVLLMSILATFRSFREIYLLAGSHPHRSIYMLQHYMNNMFAALNYQRLAPASFILAFGIVILIFLVFYLQRRVISFD